MKSTKILEMINSGRIEELKEELREEIYAETLKKKPGAKKRFAAMKKYFSYVDSAREMCQKPCIIDYEGTPHTAFCNSFSLALTKEPCGTLELFTDVDRYPDVTRLVHFEGEEKRVHLGPVLAKAHSLGYRLKKSELGPKFKYLIRFNGAYFKAGLLEATYNIIDDGGEVTLYHNGNTARPLTIKNDIGVCVVMPLRADGDPDEEIVVIDIE